MRSLAGDRGGEQCVAAPIEEAASGGRVGEPGGGGDLVLGELLLLARGEVRGDDVSYEAFLVKVGYAQRSRSAVGRARVRCMQRRTNVDAAMAEQELRHLLKSKALGEAVNLGETGLTGRPFRARKRLT